jgi:hypothetical protein
MIVDRTRQTTKIYTNNNNNRTHKTENVQPNSQTAPTTRTVVDDHVRVQIVIKLDGERMLLRYLELG